MQALIAMAGLTGFKLILAVLAALVILAVASVAVGAAFTTTNPPGPLDASMLAEASITKTASYDGTAIDLGAGFTPGGCGLPMAAIIEITASDAGNSDETYTFKVGESADNSSFTVITVAVSWTRGTTGVLTVPFFATERYQRVTLTAGGTSASITYKTYIQPIGRPG